MTGVTDEPASQDEPVLLRVYLRGGQTIEKVVTDWGVKKSSITNEITELRSESADDDRLPYIRLDAIDAVTTHPVAALVAAE